MTNRKIMVISVTAKDRPGIVAEITAGISQLGGNLADLRESVLCGYFTMILLAGFPADVSAEQIMNALSVASSSNVTVTPHEGSFEDGELPANSYVLTAVGRDRVGLVAQVSGFCFEHQVNILDLASHVDGDRYTMMLQVDLSTVSDLSGFQAGLTALSESSGLHLVLQHHDIFRATNEI